MDLPGAVYQLLIGPLELFFEVLFACAYRATGNPGAAIVVLSLAMNFLVLPLYRRADALQEQERERTVRMKPWVDHIKRTFKGDERFMMLQAYYRQCGYKQTDSLKGSVSLLLEIPFFIAAYHFLSNLELLRGVPFGPIADLGAPDALLSAGGVAVNVLPLLMTLLNLLSAAVYMRGLPLRSKVQMLGIAAIFLVLLYNSPAGLVFYWTLNNLFSLVKNVFYRLKNPRLVLSGLFSAAGLAGLVFLLLVHPAGTALRQAVLVACCVLLQVPLAARFVSGRLPRREAPEPAGAADGRDRAVFVLSCAFLTLLTGALIPSAVIGASPLEFLFTRAGISAVGSIVNSLLLAAGTFIVWFGIFYSLASPRGKRVFSAAMWVAAGVAAVDYMLFGTGYGTLTELLQFEAEPAVSATDALVNAGALLAVSAALLLVWRWSKLAVQIVAAATCIAVVCMSGLNVAAINDAVDSLSNTSAASSEEPKITLSRTGKNVVVLMMDRAASVYLPALLHEKPELKEKLDGFTYYPNTLSYGSMTNYGSPGLFGGYEYIPEKMNERSDTPLAEKHDEALKVMPVLFGENGYDVTVCDPTYAGYKWIPDLSIYDDYPYIHKYLANGKFSVEGFEGYSRATQAQLVYRRNFFAYSLFKIAPVALQPTLYDGGTYNIESSKLAFYRTDGVSKSEGLKGAFLDSYAVLCSLPGITEVTDDGKGSLFMMSNDTTHSPTLLQEPGYEPAMQVDNTSYDADNLRRSDGEGGHATLKSRLQMQHYHVNMAALLKLGEWFDYLREQGVYDNTRIIIVSDHGYRLKQDKSLVFKVPRSGGDGERTCDMGMFNCMLMVKDFGSEGFRTDDTLMTNADTPSLATEGLVENPANPFTGNPLDARPADGVEHKVVLAEDWHTESNNGNTFKPGDWFSVHDDVSDAENWKHLGHY